MSFAKPFKVYAHPSEGLRVSRRQTAVEPADGLLVPRPSGELGNGSERAMVIAASFARDKFTMSLIEPPQRTRHIPGHLESGSIVATTRRPG
jgi:hypothetical protein